MTRPKEKLILVDALYGAESAFKADRCAGLSRHAGGGGGGKVLRRLDLTAAAMPPGGRAFAGYGRGDGRRSVYRRYRPWQVFVHDGNDYGEPPGRLYPTRRRMLEKRSLTRRC